MARKEDKDSFWNNAIEQNIPVLLNGLHAVESSDTPYPKNEHTGLLDSKGCETSTPLTTIIRTRTEQISKSLSEKKLQIANTMKKNALALTYRGTPSQPINSIEWETIHRQLEPLCVQHVKLCLVKNKTTTGYVNRILAPSNLITGDFNTSSKKQMELQTKSFCLDMLADAPFECADNEKEVIDNFVAAEEDLDISSIAGRTALTPEQKLTLKNKAIAFKKGLATLRGMINHTYLKNIYKISNKAAKKYIESVHTNFLQDQYENEDSEATFTAKYLQEDIVKRCLTDNDDTTDAARKELAEMVRQVPDKPLAWLKSFAPLVATLTDALQETTLNSGDTKKWKIHFAKQLTMGEREKIFAHRDSHLLTPDNTATDVTAVDSIKDYLNGNFNTKNLKTVLAGLNDNIPPFAPDTLVKEYLRHYASNKKWKHKVDFNSKMNSGLRTADKLNKRQKLDSNGKKRHESKNIKNKNNHDKVKSRREQNSSSSASVPVYLQCKRPRCIEKGVNKNHTHENCFHKNKQHGQTKSYPNLGKANPKPAKIKAGMRTASRRPEKTTCWSCSKVGCDKHKCYICGGNHPKRDCPDKPKVVERLSQSKNFNHLMGEVFEPRLYKCAEKVISTWGEQVCSHCYGSTCKRGKCRDSDKSHRNKMREVKQLYTNNPELMDILEQAHHDPFQSNQMQTMNAAFLASTEGQEESDDNRGQFPHDSDQCSTENDEWSFHTRDKSQYEDNTSSSDDGSYRKRNSSIESDDSQMSSSFRFKEGSSNHKRQRRGSTSSQSADDDNSESEKDSCYGTDVDTE